MANLTINKSVENDLKVIKADDKNTSLSLAESGNGAMVDGNLIITNDIQVGGNIQGNLSRNYFIPGSIIGYTDIGLNEAAVGYNLTTSYAVPTDELSVSFIAPPSGNVEIFMQIGWDAGSSNAGDCYAGLSTANATDGYAQLQDYHEVELLDAMARGALRTIRHSWTVTGLIDGREIEYWVGFKTSSTGGTPHLQWGGDTSDRNTDFIMKAIALPATIKT